VPGAYIYGIWLVVETKHWEIRFSFVRLRALLRSRERETGESLCFEIFAIQALRCARSGFVIVHDGVIKRSNSCTTCSPLPNLKFPFFSNFCGHFWVFSDLLVWLHCSLFCVLRIPSNLPIPWPSVQLSHMKFRLPKTSFFYLLLWFLRRSSSWRLWGCSWLMFRFYEPLGTYLATGFNWFPTST
jgi:hypothetical protein